MIQAIDDFFMDTGDAISTLLYDVTGLQFRVIVILSYMIFSHAVLSYIMEGDPISSIGEWSEIAICGTFGLAGLWVFTRFPKSMSNSFCMLIRVNPGSMVFRVVFSTWMIGLGVMAIVQNNPMEIIHNFHYAMVTFWAFTQVPDRPRRKLRMPRLFSTPAPQGA